MRLVSVWEGVREVCVRALRACVRVCVREGGGRERERACVGLCVYAEFGQYVPCKDV